MLRLERPQRRQSDSVQLIGSVINTLLTRYWSGQCKLTPAVKCLTVVCGSSGSSVDCDQHYTHWPSGALGTLSQLDPSSIAHDDTRPQQKIQAKLCRLQISSAYKRHTITEQLGFKERIACVPNIHCWEGLAGPFSEAFLPFQPIPACWAGDKICPYWSPVLSSPANREPAPSEGEVGG